MKLSLDLVRPLSQAELRKQGLGYSLELRVVKKLPLPTRQLQLGTSCSFLP